MVTWRSQKEWSIWCPQGGHQFLLSQQEAAWESGRKWFMNSIYSPGELQRYLGRETPGDIRKFYSRVDRQPNSQPKGQKSCHWLVCLAITVLVNNWIWRIWQASSAASSPNYPFSLIPAFHIFTGKFLPHPSLEEDTKP